MPLTVVHADNEMLLENPVISCCFFPAIFGYFDLKLRFLSHNCARIGLNFDKRSIES